MECVEPDTLTIRLSIKKSGTIAHIIVTKLVTMGVLRTDCDYMVTFVPITNGTKGNYEN